MSDFLREQAKKDFERARMREFFERILSFTSPERQELLPLDEVKKLLRPKGERYLGLKTVPIDKIVGSEGRYLDFNKKFLPRHGHTRGRWESIDQAHLAYKELPPVKLYEVGGVYFVRDGNHRVSVAKSKGSKFIDAEVTSLNAEIPLHPDMTLDELRKRVIDYEYAEFREKTDMERVLPGVEIRFSTPGRYDELYEHILVHKYYINMDKDYEIPFEEAFRSWYENVYRPIVEVIRKENILSMFPGRTEGDLYLWCVKHWDDLKRQYGQDYDLRTAVIQFAQRHGTTWKRRLSRWWKRLTSWLRRPPADPQ
ncbi:hypothetical protein [Spirochaeta thermophila]|uniref:Transcriptional regulator n=1 Tax=Winmispira thermophila (strain ATCC 49972 / DSM 6192 / RI 19.B1) TaxID=665571 RepID=E0RR39_WINT6|nr:hypothetical protein [Spirochaeta thermophila]ADN01617.1 transcriptional regulator [Spirochaeta thermophila DSM 6192]